MAGTIPLHGGGKLLWHCHASARSTLQLTSVTCGCTAKRGHLLHGGGKLLWHCHELARSTLELTSVTCDFTAERGHLLDGGGEQVDAGEAARDHLPASVRQGEFDHMLPHHPNEDVLRPGGLLEEVPARSTAPVRSQTARQPDRDTGQRGRVIWLE
eukprot:8743434-Pyramimonas_sp.AAC.1